MEVFSYTAEPHFCMGDSTYPEQQKQQVKRSKIPHGICGWVILFHTPDGWFPPTASLGRATWVNCMGIALFFTALGVCLGTPIQFLFRQKLSPRRPNLINHALCLYLLSLLWDTVAKLAIMV